MRISENSCHFALGNYDNNYIHELHDYKEHLPRHIVWNLFEMMYQINQEERIVNSYRSCTADLLACENMWLLYFFRFDVVVMLYLNKHACTKQLCSRNKSNGNNAALELCLDSND